MVDSRGGFDGRAGFRGGGRPGGDFQQGGPPFGPGGGGGGRDRFDRSFPAPGGGMARGRGGMFGMQGRSGDFGGRSGGRAPGFGPMAGRRGGFGGSRGRFDGGGRGGGRGMMRGGGRGMGRGGGCFDGGRMPSMMRGGFSRGGGGGPRSSGGRMAMGRFGGGRTALRPGFHAWRSLEVSSEFVLCARAPKIDTTAAAAAAEDGALPSAADADAGAAAAQSEQQQSISYQHDVFGLRAYNREIMYGHIAHGSRYMLTTPGYDSRALGEPPTGELRAYYSNWDPEPVPAVVRALMEDRFDLLAAVLAAGEDDSGLHKATGGGGGEFLPPDAASSDMTAAAAADGGGSSSNGADAAAAAAAGADAQQPPSRAGDAAAAPSGPSRTPPSSKTRHNVKLVVRLGKELYYLPPQPQQRSRLTPPLSSAPQDPAAAAPADTDGRLPRGEQQQVSQQQQEAAAPSTPLPPLGADSTAAAVAAQQQHEAATRPAAAAASTEATSEPQWQPPEERKWSAPDLALAMQSRSVRTTFENNLPPVQLNLLRQRIFKDAQPVEQNIRYKAHIQRVGSQPGGPELVAICEEDPSRPGRMLRLVSVKKDEKRYNVDVCRPYNNVDMRIQATVDATLGSPDEVEAVRAFVETKMRLGPWGTPRSSSAAEQDDGGAAEPPPPPLPVGGAGDERDLVQALIEQGAVYRLRRFRRIDKQIYLLPDAAGVPGRMQWSMVTQVIQTKDEREADKGVKLMNMMEVQYVPIKEVLAAVERRGGTGSTAEAAGNGDDSGISGGVATAATNFDREALAVQFKKFLGEVWRATAAAPAAAAAAAAAATAQPAGAPSASAAAAAPTAGATA